MTLPAFRPVFSPATERPEPSAAAMTLSYETYLEDFVELHFRRHFQTGEGKRRKWQTTAIASLAAATLPLLILRDREPGVLLTWVLVYAVGIGLLQFLIYVPKLRRSYRKYFARLLAGRLPTVATFRIEDDRLFSEVLGTTISLRLSDLEEVTEERGYLVISFGKTGLCTIPLRAFESDEQKAAFVALLERGKTAPEA